MKLFLDIEIFMEGDVYVAVSPQLNVSSFGDTIDEAKASIREALSAFIEECQDMGTLEDVLEESGLLLTEDSWMPRKPVEQEKLALSV